MTAGVASHLPVLIGLTGPIGCGKSTVAGWLRDAGGTVIDADRLARQATGRGTAALPAIRARFGESVFSADGVLDRAALARVVFSDPGALRDLEAIVHPEVRRLLLAALAAADREGAPFVVLEAIKLVEGGFSERCDEVWLVECDPGEQRRRLARRGVPAEEVERRILAQGPDLASRLAPRVSRRISTDGTPAAVRERVEDALADVLEAALRGEEAVRLPRV